MILYNSTDELIDDLLIHKKIDAGYVTEADYGIYISNKIREKENVELFNREYINKNKKTILQNLQFINEKGSINPVQKWIIEASWNIYNFNTNNTDYTIPRSPLKYKHIK